eukprot:CAMPEP_0178453950 /NCGR_PEP_ID=MMETSP0689_2-20121128/45087_1 /TAXON_ID=160604 /ORGANISM="Amphidinium massartii, Strain CS-259" /LENGTH=42 /DNA_ID= /DNA_START= /DNA_END= /DNA_ORIENTATION=
MTWVFLTSLAATAPGWRSGLLHSRETESTAKRHVTWCGHNSA